MSSEIKYLNDPLDDRMILLVLSYVKPLLSSEHHILVRARACELISYYSYLELPEEHLTLLAESIYGCMMVGNTEKETFLKIYACNAFNTLMKYSTIAQFIRPFIPDILKIYTDLLPADSSIIKNFEDLIDLLEDDIAPFANNLSKLFIDMFFGYVQRYQKNFPGDG